MLIAIDASRALRARRTGTERYAQEIICHLLALPEAARHRWRLYTDTPPPLGMFPSNTATAAAPNVSISVLPGRRLWTHRTLAAELRRHRPDVLFVPAHVLPLIPFGWLPPSVVTIHDLGYHAHPEAHTTQQRAYLIYGTRWSVWVAKRVIAVSRCTAHDLSTHYQVHPEKIDVIYEAPPARVPVDQEAVAAIRRKFGLQRPYALFVGTLQPRKNIVRLAQAFAQLVARGDVPWDLVLAGAPGWLSADLLATLDSLHLNGRLHRLGYVDEADLPPLLSGACMFVFPSLYEGFGLPVLEAQNYGAPVVTANNSSLPEIAGDAALLVDPNDVDAIATAMLRLSQDEALRRSLITAGYANVKRFSWERAAQETLAVLEKAAAAGHA
ncbi:MAG: glycosyltransferase family 4 protein [Anaerolineales bacterium]|nr:glycosyltransferase family 4 protein [Anaerolineales bacterium]